MQLRKSSEVKRRQELNTRARNFQRRIGENKITEEQEENRPWRLYLDTARGQSEVRKVRSKPVDHRREREAESAFPSSGDAPGGLGVPDGVVLQGEVVEVAIHIVDHPFLVQELGLVARWLAPFPGPDAEEGPAGGAGRGYLRSDGGRRAPIQAPILTKAQPGERSKRGGDEV